MTAQYAVTVLVKASRIGNRPQCVDEQIGRIKQWLAGQLGATSAENHADRITLRISDREYTLRIDPSYLCAYPGDRAVEMLQQWHVADELCRAEGLHFILTPSGLRLGSSN